MKPLTYLFLFAAAVAAFLFQPDDAHGGLLFNRGGCANGQCGAAQVAAPTPVSVEVRVRPTLLPIVKVVPGACKPNTPVVVPAIPPLPACSPAVVLGAPAGAATTIRKVVLFPRLRTALATRRHLLPWRR